MEFTKALFERMIPQTIGMDFTEVNFELTSGQERKKDEETFRDILEMICHQVNQPVYDERLLRMPDADSLYRRFDKI
jgi:hypothetical protein